MAGTSVNGAKAHLARLFKRLPTAQSIAEVAILQKLVRILLAHIGEIILARNGPWLEKKYRRQQQPRDETTSSQCDSEAP
jgi:hypothetical protein